MVAGKCLLLLLELIPLLPLLLLWLLRRLPAQWGHALPRRPRRISEKLATTAEPVALLLLLLLLPLLFVSAPQWRGIR